MNLSWIIAKRDLKGFFYSPVAYILLAVQGAFLGFVLRDNMSLLNLASWFSFLMLLICPAITMRSISEEKKTKSIVLLFTLPIKDWEIILGKFIANVLTLSILLGATLLYPVMMKMHGVDIGWKYFSVYMGLFLFGSGCLAIGLFISSLTENQIISAVVTFMVLLTLLVLGNVSQYADDYTGVATRRILEFFSSGTHFESFIRGYIDLRDILYFVSQIVVFLFLATRVLESRKWR